MEFHRDSRSGLAPYLQIVEQVKEASRLGLIGGLPPETVPRIRRKLLPWLREAKAAGLDDESILALVNNTLREQAQARVA